MSSEEKIYSPWAHPNNRAVSSGRNARLYGFRDFRAIAMLGDITAPCPTCGATGLLGTYGAIGWHLCPTCNGLGEAYTISIEELEARRLKALEAYPDAGVPNWLPNAGGIGLRCVQEELQFPEVGGGLLEFLPLERCVRWEPPVAKAPRPPAEPRLWGGLWVLLKMAWRKWYA
jgi:hypothetical protein